MGEIRLRGMCAALIAALAPAEAVVAAEVDLPPYPYVETGAFYIDGADLELRADAYCAAEPRGDAVDFYLGALPQASLDDLCLADDATAEALLGHLYISGYFGGIWLRDALLPQVDLRRQPWPLPPSALVGPAASERGAVLEAAVIRALGAVVGRATEKAQTGGDANVQLSARGALSPLLFLYGYNLGYLQVLLDHPPTGVEPDANALVCGEHILDCRSESVELAVFDEYDDAIMSVAQPQGPRWGHVAELVETVGIPAVEDGAAVWEDILAEDEVDPVAYGPLVDVSVGFLMATDAAVLAAATAWGDGDAQAGRCTLLLEAGLTLWSGSYFMGLASDDPAGTFPELSCR